MRSPERRVQRRVLREAARLESLRRPMTVARRLLAAGDQPYDRDDLSLAIVAKIGCPLRDALDAVDRLKAQGELRAEGPEEHDYLHLEATPERTVDEIVGRAAPRSTTMPRGRDTAPAAYAGEEPPASTGASDLSEGISEGASFAASGRAPRASDRLPGNGGAR